MAEAAASAPAKAMLFGEYAVLEGAPALALALDRRIRATARRGDGRGVVVRSALLDGPVEADPTESVPHPVLRFVWPLLQAAAGRAPGRVELAFDAGFPPVWGLGSSSASTLAAAAALRALDGLDCGPEVLFAEAMAEQRRVQGSASGYDVATQIVGGCTLFRPEPLVMERVAGPARSWIVAWTGDKVSTGSMIRSVRVRHPRGAPIYARIGALAEAAVGLVRAGDDAALGDALTEGQRLLEELGASPDWAGEAVAGLTASPAIHGARLSGAGGGDCVVVLAEDPGAAALAVEAAGLTVLDLRVDPVGLIVERDPA